MGRRRAGAIALTLGLALIVGCTPDGGDQPTPTESAVTSTAPPADLPPADDVAGALAEGLTGMDVSGIAVGDPEQAQTDLEDILAGMGTRTPTVTLKTVEYSPSEGGAAAVLEHVWDIGVDGWTYETRAPLEHTEDGWQVTWTPQLIHSQLTSDSRLRMSRSWPKRAPINDNSGLALVEERTLYRVGIDKSRIEESEWATSAASLATIVGIDPDAYSSRVLAGGDKQYVVALTMRQEQISPEISDVPGSLVQETKGVVGPADNWGVSLLGTVGHPNAEQIAESDGELTAQDTIGLSGLQSRYEERLRGIPEIKVELVGRNTEEDPNAASEFEPQTLFDQASSVGDPLSLSLDRDLQTRAEEVLSTQEGLATLVVIRPSDGALLAAANSPAAGVYPQATFGKFAPGSTFKVVSALAMLRAGFTATSPVKCDPTLNVSGYEFGNYSGYPAAMTGTITLTQALAHSCNTSFAAAAASITPEQLHAAAATLGVGTDYDAGFTSYFGTVAPNNTAIDRAASMIGQGQITMSPLGMAAVAASVASGKTTIPWLVEGTQAEPEAAPLTEEEAAQLQQMMSAVVTDGSAKVLEGLMTGAKTGTAQWGPVGDYQTHAWMIAWNADYAVASFVEVGDSGSGTAAPLIIELFS